MNEGDFLDVGSRAGAQFDLADETIVSELFSSVADEVFYRTGAVLTHTMSAQKARDMDDALERHLARALMGENPQFSAVPGWSGLPCALSLLEQAIGSNQNGELESAQSESNPRIVMTLAANAFVKSTYALIHAALREPEMTEQKLKDRIHRNAADWAQAAFAPKAHA